MAKKKFAGTAVDNNSLGFQSELPKNAEKGQKAPTGELVQRPRENDKYLNKKTGKQASESVEDEEEYVEDELEEQVTAGNTPAAAKPAAPVALTAKKQKELAKKQTKDDMEMLEEEGAAAKKLRIQQRFLRMLFVGFLLEWWNGDAAGETPKAAGKEKNFKKTKAKSKKDDDDGMSVREMTKKVQEYSGPVFMGAMILAVCGMAIAGDGYQSMDPELESVDHYGTLGVERGAAAPDIKKAYKKLALDWHPDKHSKETCPTCEEVFAGISKAYDVLSNPEKRQAFDNRRTSKGGLTKSEGSVTLTGYNFEATVLRSNDVWAVEVYDSVDDGPSEGFAPIWEDVASKKKDIMRFGRIDKTTDEGRAALSFLPHRSLMTPSIFRFARGMTTEDWLPSDRSAEDSSRPLVRFLSDSYPGFNSLSTAAAVKAWRNPDKMQLLLVGRAPKDSTHGMRIRHAMHLWGTFIDFAVIETKVGKEAFPESFTEERYSESQYVLLGFHSGKGAASKQITKKLDEVSGVHEALEHAVSKMIDEQAPFLTLRNYEQLCKPQGSYAQMRLFCLVLVDASEEEAQKAMSDVKASNDAYKQEVTEMAESESDGTPDEPLHIQVVRVASSSSRDPRQPPAVSAAFRKVWAATGKGKWVVLEIASRRTGGGKATDFQDIYQKIAYDDLKMVDMPEGMHFASILPDPEESFKNEIRRLLVSSPLFALVVFVTLAAIVSVAPELEPLHAALCVAAVMALFGLLWAPAFRRCASIFTSTVV